MKSFAGNISAILVAFVSSWCNSAPALGQQPTERVVLTRVFFQDDDTLTLRWADLYAGTPPTLGTVQTVSGFPKLDATAQTLVQMGAARGMILVGVRDSEDGKKLSGWVLVDSGVHSEDHGGHSHSTYHQQPRIRATCLDDKQGNPAHMYVYDEMFYLANDKLSGYTRINPAAIRPKDNAAAIVSKVEFIPGGGGHITLAALGKSVGYSTWIDRAGDNQGRVDVTPFAKRQIAYSFMLPHGGIHGATTNGGKVFFAPSDGICWVQGDPTATQSAATIKVQHLSLGKVAESEKPIRTGAFANFGKHVLFLTGAGPNANLHWLDATSSTPSPQSLPLNLEEGARPVGPIIGMTTGNWPMALIFHDHNADSSSDHHVSLIELDPNADGGYGDARVAKVLKVGRSKVEGHGGHHDAAFVPDLRHAIFTNPGDGTLGLVRVRRQELVTEFKVGGSPSKIEAIGGPSGH